MSGRGWRVAAVLLSAVSICLSACADKPALPPIPAELVDAAQVPGFDPVRQWGDAPGVVARSAWAEGGLPSPPTPPSGSHGPLNVLAISGGGSNGSFAAGLLTGLTAAGDRPDFHVVTGVSVGALTAPFAFLGPQYDGALRELCSNLSSGNTFVQKPLLVAYLSDALASDQRLASIIAKAVDDSVRRAIADEHRKGRRLFVATTHVYAGRPVIWDIGAIASSGRPGALHLIHRVLLASAAAPILLPPVYFEVEAAGQRYHEMHVDGGLTREAFVGPPGLDWVAAADALGTAESTHFYVIRNGRARAEYMVMAPSVLPLGQHAMHQLSQSLGLADLYRIYLRAQQDHAAFHAAWIGSDFAAPWSDWHDAGYIKALFDYGYARAVKGDAWHSLPPGVEQGS